MKAYFKISHLISIVLLVCCAHASFAQMQFIENKGQWEKQVQYKSEIPNGAFFLERTGFTVVMHKEEDMRALEDRMHGGSDVASGSTTGTATSGSSSTQVKAKAVISPSPSGGVTLHSHAYRVVFSNASPNVQAIPDKLIPTYNNYFIGNDPAKWQSGCKIYQAITYKNIYPNIDVRYYTDQGTLKYDIIVNPGGRVEDIAMRYEGADKLSIRNKELIIGTSVGEVKELYPYTYQVKDKGRETLDCKYQLSGNTVKFKVKDYDPSATVVIDPTVIFCSFTGSTKDNWGYTATPGPDGSFFAGGIVFGEGFPVSPGAFESTYQGGAQEDDNGPYDIAIIKLSANGSKRLYATYLGGSSNEQPHSMICDAQGNLIVAGRTSSTNYPTRTTNVGSTGMYDIVVTKFNADGTNILGSIKVGGSKDDGINIKPKYVSLPGNKQGAYDTRRNYGDDARGEVILDAANNIYVASCTQSNDFPVRNSTIQTTFGGGGQDIQQDGVIMKITPDLSAVMFSTYFGGSGNDACFVLAINPLTGNLYVGGGTTSSNLPGDQSGVISSNYYGGEVDGFVTSLRPDGSALLKTTYIGTNGSDVVYGVQFDKFGFPYIMGTTTGTWTAINASFSNAGGKQFIGKLQPNLSSYVYSTMFGTPTAAPNISPIAFLVDRCQNVYVSGWGGKFNNDRGYPCAGTSGMDFLITSNAVQSRGDGNDFFFFVLERDAQSQLFGSYYGQYGGFADHVDGGTSRFDANGIIYQAMCANCNNQPGEFFPTTPGVWAPSNPSKNCNEAMLKIEMNFAGVGASVKATINGVFDTIGCVPLTVRFIDTLAKGKKYIWSYGDGTKSDTTFAPNNFSSHTYNSVGVFRLMLVSIDSLTCNISDTAYINVRVGNNEVKPNFNAVKIGGCQSNTFQFNNTSTAVIPVYTPNSFLWDFGDGTTPQRAGINAVTHTYASPGIYNVKLTVDDSVFCNAPDTITKQVRLAVNVKAQFETPDRGCQPYTAHFKNTSLGGTDFQWDFGDGTTSTDIDPTHTYPNTGTYTVKLTAIDTTTCNKTDVATFPITVYPVPTAEYDFGPKPGDINKPINFTNQSVGANSYVWDFGDGETSIAANPSHIFNETATFNVCLIATNAAGCSDTICKPVQARVNPLLDVPNAFTPTQPGVNSVIAVRGYGVKKMSWKIYNRWGQLVFESASLKSSWDGTFKGTLQPQDVYTYTLDAEFTDGKKLRKTGDITLLR